MWVYGVLGSSSIPTLIPVGFEGCTTYTSSSRD
jgi:hypothetical protein